MNAPFDASNPDVPLRRFEGEHPAVPHANEIVAVLEWVRQQLSKKGPVPGGGGGSSGTPMVVVVHIDGERYVTTVGRLSALNRLT